MPAKIIEIEDIGTVRLYKRRGSRSIRLGFDSKGDIRVSLPTWAPYQSAINFVKTRADWIEQHRPRELRVMYEQGQRIGKAHRLVLKPDFKVKSVQVRLLESDITVKYPANLPATSVEVQKACERGAKRALHTEAERLLPQKLRSLALQHDFKFRGVEVKQLISKWGSCDQNQDITLNYYLMQLPWQLIDYVLLHELVHTEHLNHSQGFWKRFESIMPDAKKVRKELKSYKTIVVASV
jgi:predicted metal-dependent hydrolase